MKIAKIPAVGSYPDIEAEEYHSWFAASNSLLKKFIDSTPAHVLRSFNQERTVNKAFQFGDILHAIMFMPQEWGKMFGVIPSGLKKTTKEGKAAFADLLTVYPEERIISTDTFNQIKEARENILANNICKKIFESLILKEHSIVWNDTFTDVLCKARLDAVSKLGFVVDLKTTVSASPSEFQRSIYKYGYHTQAAHYMRAAKSAGLEVKHHIIIALEKETNFVAIYELDSEAIEAGEKELDRVLPIWKKCIESDEWPAYSEKIQKISLPKWALNEIKYMEENE